MYGFGYEKQLPEFLTYYLDILGFDYVIFVEDFKSDKEYTNNSVMKNICNLFGERVIYDYLIQNSGKCDLFSYPFAHKRDQCQLYITYHYLKKIKSKIPKNEHSNTWLLYVNGDEFLNLNGLTIKSFISKYAGNYVGLSFMQQLFGDNGVEEHKYNDLLIDSHRYSEKIELGKPKPKYITQFINPITGFNNSDISNKGFKAMYRLSGIKKGWIHPAYNTNILKNIYNSNLYEAIFALNLSHYYIFIAAAGINDINIKTIHHDTANINHYWVIDKKTINNHFINNTVFNNRNKIRIKLNTLINTNAKIHSHLYRYSDLIRHNKYYNQCMEYLDTIFN